MYPFALIAAAGGSVLPNPQHVPSSLPPSSSFRQNQAFLVSTAPYFPRVEFASNQQAWSLLSTQLITAIYLIWLPHGLQGS